MSKKIEKPEKKAEISDQDLDKMRQLKKAGVSSLLVIFVLPVAVLLGILMMTVWSEPSFAQTDNRCVDAAQRIFSKVIGGEAKSRRTTNLAEEAKRICDLRITPAMQMRAAREALVKFYGVKHPYKFFAGKVRGVNQYAPTIMMFSQRARRIDVAEISSKARGLRIGYVAVSNSANNPPVIAVSSGVPYHIGRSEGIISKLSHLRQRGPYRVEAIAGHPMAPVLFVRTGTGKRFAYSHVQEKLLSQREIRKLVPNLSEIKNWTPLVYNRLDWTRFEGKRRVKRQRQSLGDFLIRPAQAFSDIKKLVPCSKSKGLKRWLKEAWSVPNYDGYLYGGSDDCGPVAAAMALAYFNKFTPGLLPDPDDIESKYCLGSDLSDAPWPPQTKMLKTDVFGGFALVKKYSTTFKKFYFDYYNIDQTKCTAYQARHKLIMDLSKSMPYNECWALGTNCGTWDWGALIPGFSGNIGPTVRKVAAERNTKAKKWWTGDSDNTKFGTFNWHMERNNPVLLMIKWPGNTAIGGHKSGKSISWHWMPVIGTYYQKRKAQLCSLLYGWCSKCHDDLFRDIRYVAVRTGWVEGQATKGGENLVDPKTVKITDTEKNYFCYAGKTGEKCNKYNANDYTWLNYHDYIYMPGTNFKLGSDWYYVRLDDYVVD